MRHTILSLLFCTLPFTAMAAESVDSSNVNSGVNSNEKGVEKITIEGAATANNKPVGTFNSPISNLEYDPRVDLQFLLERRVSKHEGEIDDYCGLLQIHTGCLY